MSDDAAGYGELPRTAYLDHTLRRARTAAEQRSHRYVTLEHLLLTLLDDPDAVQLLKTVGADTAVIQTTISDAVNNRMAALVDPSGRPPSFSYKFDSLFAAASGDAIRLGRRQVDGACALIAVARDPESNAAAILAANGFQPLAALNALGDALPAPAAAPPPRAPLSPSPHIEAAAPPRPEPYLQQPRTGAVTAQPSVPPAAFTPGPSVSASENLMEDMLASVRDILDAEERKERGFTTPSPPPSAPPPPRTGPMRFEPQLRAEAAPERKRLPVPTPPSPYPTQARIEPGLQPAAPAEYRRQDADQLAAQPQPSERRRKGASQKAPGRSRGEASGQIEKLLQGIPRKARIGTADMVKIELSKEDAGFLFARLPRRGQPRQGGEALPVCRAVTVRLQAPEGGFFIEPSSAETQWILDRPPIAGQEPFGTWSWVAIPNETGWFVLSVSISARDIDGSGVLGDLAFPEQAIKVRVHGSFTSRLWGIIRVLLLVLTGSAVAVGALLVLAKIGKLPHWFAVH